MGEVERTPITRSAKCRVLPLLIKGGTPLGSVKKGARLPTTQKIVAELPPNRDVDSDITSWRLEDRQTFIMKSAYDHLRASSDNNALEDITHVLRDCIVARDLWVKVLPLAHLNSFFQLHADEWLRVNLFAPAGFLIVLMEWPRKFAILCSLLWKNRCCRVMGSECLHREELLDLASMEYEDPPVELLDLIREEASSLL
ncbi:hypothetical protein V6N13_108614 [Hibiscus sabdariffa]